jgi:hypothetical protein
LIAGLERRHAVTDERFEVEPTGDKLNRIHQRLGLDSTRVHAPELTVLGVALHAAGVRGGALLPRMAEQQFGDERLERAVVVLAESPREVIEQLGMTRRVACEAKVVRGAHEPLAEDVMPHAIHDDALHERVFRAQQPVGEFSATAGVGGQARRFARRV